MRTPPAVTLALAALLTAAGAQAQSMATARVLASTPIYEDVPSGACAPAGPGGYVNGVGAAIGALLGGLIGSQFGRGSGHAAGAVIGALGGAFLGNAAEAQQRGYTGGCQAAYPPRLLGYDVTYEYAGRQYRTRTDRDPGAWIQVPVADAYGGAAQAYPVAPPPVAAYPLPDARAARDPVVTAPRGVVGGYPNAAPAYPAPVAPMQAMPPNGSAYVTPVGVSLPPGGAGWGAGDAW